MCNGDIERGTHAPPVWNMNAIPKIALRKKLQMTCFTLTSCILSIIFQFRTSRNSVVLFGTPWYFDFNFKCNASS